MRVLITGTSYFPEFSAGTEVYMRYVSRYLVEQGDRVRIACGGNDFQGWTDEPKWMRTEFGFEGIPVTRIARNKSRAALTDNYTRTDPERHAIWQKLFSEVAPQLVFTVGRGPALMGDVEQSARNAGIPVVATLIHPDQVCPKGPRLDAWGQGCMRGLDSRTCCACMVRSRSRWPGLHHVLKLLPGYMLPGSLPRNGLGSKLRTALSLPQLVIGFLGHWIELRQAVSLFVAHSPEAVELLRTNGVPDSQIRFSAPGLEPQLRVPRAPRTTGPVRFGFVGRPCAEKGVQTLVKAWQLLPRTAAVELHFWGNPETGEPEVVAQVRSLCAGDSRAVFHGPFAREQIDSVYDGMDALLVPSEWFDNCPFVISEAFAAGLPVLGSDFGGIKSMIRHEVDGLLVAMGDACAWAAALARLAANPQTVQAFSRNVLPPRDAREHVRDLRVFFAELARNGARG